MESTSSGVWLYVNDLPVYIYLWLSKPRSRRRVIVSPTIGVWTDRGHLLACPSSCLGLEARQWLEWMQQGWGHVPNNGYSSCAQVCILLQYRSHLDVLILSAMWRSSGSPAIERLFFLPVEIVSRCAVIENYRDKVALLATESPYTNLRACTLTRNCRIINNQLERARAKSAITSSPAIAGNPHFGGGRSGRCLA